MTSIQDAARLVDARIEIVGGWRGPKLVQLRSPIMAVDPRMV